MAIVFISPQKTQRIFFRTSFAVVLLLLAGISVVILLPEIKNQLKVEPAVGVYAPPDVNIDFSVLDSEKVKKLDPFVNIQVEYFYQAKDQNGLEATGTILAYSKKEAQTILEGRGLVVSDIQQTNIGKPDPFIPLLAAPAPSAP